MKVSANSQEATIQGFDIGADDYMTKPFSESLLISRIQNLLESRKKSNDRFGKSMFISELIKHRDKNEQQFIQRPIEIINKNIRNESFKLSNLAENINILVRSFPGNLGKNLLCLERSARKNLIHNVVKTRFEKLNNYLWKVKNS